MDDNIVRLIRKPQAASPLGMVVAAGAMVVAPRDIPHRFRNVGPGQGRFLLTIIPGRFANYFFEVAGVLDNRTALAALGAKYGVETLA